MIFKRNCKPWYLFLWSFLIWTNISSFASYLTPAKCKKSRLGKDENKNKFKIRICNWVGWQLTSSPQLTTWWACHEDFCVHIVHYLSWEKEKLYFRLKSQTRICCLQDTFGSIYLNFMPTWALLINRRFTSWLFSQFLP